ncbi:hypothetical protein D3OALGA1CA_2560 [Olavius algarvensis associated proteobacterium Delta 3]|nr:hypothetical protein D3OALGA1CA_2560 [Olavius algarvensis associated proteobacterium Delta 3]CAB5146419.1 hypothetical protein D3OALGB2SA_4534 [Olavius algarvensis associated proteobacterium Delta 3]
MILSFHPCIVGDQNVICAGRDPGRTDLEAISAASAVILSQGVRPALYWMARNHSALVFPDYDARFSFPGKTGQMELFQKYNAPHPRSRVFQDTEDFNLFRRNSEENIPMDFPLVLKLDWGGEGDTVYFVTSHGELDHALARVHLAEGSGNGRFLIQDYVPGADRSLRVVVIGRSFHPYWRVQQDSGSFLASLAGGAEIDYDSDPELMSAGVQSVKKFCRVTGINLAGFDLLFAEDSSKPLFIEINYFFGRRGLGGSESFYAMLDAEIRRWLEENGLSLPKTTEQP